MEPDPSAGMAMQSIEPLPFVMALSRHTNKEPYNLMEVLSRMLYGSNMIAHTGGSLPTTYRLCCAVFDERLHIPEEITQNDYEYEEIKQHLEFRNIPASPGRILQSYRETLQLAQAAKYLIQKTVLDRQDFDEATLKEAHHILTYKIDLDPQISWTAYSGKYREWNPPNDMRFLNSADITTAMPSMINDLVVEMDPTNMQQLTKEAVYDWICDASRFCQRFILIRPFLDGNGRMYRLFLTTLLLIAGICPAVYGLYKFDRFYHSKAEASCFGQNNQELLVARDVVPYVNNHYLARFVLEHTHGGWESPDRHMRTFLQATGHVQNDHPLSGMGHY
ncbi:hypothetical protein F25303_6169 [Fusarium sp. NRRL 25303]|nr:hypothetical protein F25303_6169 [Fusarium sp. NRRL 25303]